MARNWTPLPSRESCKNAPKVRIANNCCNFLSILYNGTHTGSQPSDFHNIEGTLMEEFHTDMAETLITLTSDIVAAHELCRSHGNSSVSGSSLPSVPVTEATAAKRLVSTQPRRMDMKPPLLIPVL